jgi:hypothetical protein
MALPRDSLQSFRSVKFKVGYHVLSAIFRAHSRISTLAVYVDESKAPGDFSSGLPSASRIQNSLSNLLCVIIHASGECSYKELSTWFPYATALDRVETQGDSSGSGTHFTGWQPLLAGAPLFKLCHLHLLYLQFSESAGGIVGTLHLPSLRRLVLGNCSTVAPLLSALAQGLRTSGSFSLAQIGILCIEVSESDVEALEKVFASLESLEVVAYSTMKGRLPSLNTLQGNADSLRNLFVDSSGFDQIYSMRDFEQLSAKLTSLKKLSLSVGDLNPMIDYLDMLEPFDLRNDEDYMKKLVRCHIDLSLHRKAQRLKVFRDSLRAFHSSKSCAFKILHTHPPVTVPGKDSFGTVRLLSRSSAIWLSPARRFSCSVSDQVSKLRVELSTRMRTIMDMCGRDTCTEGVMSLRTRVGSLRLSRLLRCLLPLRRDESTGEDGDGGSWEQT